MRKGLTAVIVVACFVVAAWFGCDLVNDLLKYQKVDNDNHALVKEVVRKGRKRKGKRGYSKKALARHIRFDILRRRNPDICAWIYVPGTGIDYAVLKGRTNNTYLHRNFRRQYSFAGSIFMDEMCDRSFRSDNTILYGHNMKSGSMFVPVKRFVYGSYFRKHPYVYVYLPDGSLNVYAVFSSNIIRATSDLYSINIDYQAYVKRVLAGAEVKTKYNLDAIKNVQAPLLMMSTCSAPHVPSRHVLYSRLDRHIV